jgi:hypothetical protein
VNDNQWCNKLELIIFRVMCWKKIDDQQKLTRKAVGTLQKQLRLKKEDDLEPNSA